MSADWRFALAMRLFGATGGNRLVSFVGLLSVSGLVLAVAVLVTVLSIMNGFERELRERVLGVVPHGTLYSRGKIDDWQHLVAEFRQHSSVLGAAPVVEGSGLVVRDETLVGVSFQGVLPEYEQTVSRLPRYFISGGLDSLTEKPFGVVMGQELADTLGLVVGGKVTLVLPGLTYTLAGPAFTTRALNLVGLFRVGADIDRHQLFVHLPTALRLKRQRGVDGIVIKTADVFAAPQVLHELVQSSEDKTLYGVSWMRRYGNLYDAIGTQKATMFLLLIILVAVAAFNIVSNLVMTVDENRSGIAILRTLGASPFDLRLVFMVHGMLVGVFGVLLGVASGVLLTLSLSTLYRVVSDWFSLNLMSEYFIRQLPTEILMSDITYISVVSLIICLVATIYPATRAANAIPVEVLQHEV